MEDKSRQITNYSIEGRRKPQSAPASSSWERRLRDQKSDERKKWNSSRWRKFGESVFGHAPHIQELIDGVETMGNKKCLSLVVNIFRSILLSISSTVFVSNPLSGLIILTTMLVYSADKAATLGLISLFFGIIFFIWPLGRPWHLLIRGSISSITFNCFLLGSSLPLLAGSGAEETTSWQDVISLIPLAAVLGVFVVYLWSGCNGILARADLPVLSAPTNILALLLFYSGYFPQIQQDNGTTLLSANNSESLSSSSCDCSITDQLWNGVILSQGIIFQVGIPQSYIIYLSVLIYSPILFCQEIIGGLIGTLIGMGLEGPCGVDIWNGSWGYNSLLTAGAIGGIFIRFNFHSFLLSIIGAVLSGFLCGVLKKNHWPLLGIPFMIATWLMLPLATFPVENDGSVKLSCLDLHRVVEFSTPELNSICRMKLYSRKKYVTDTRVSSSILHI